MLLPLLLLLLFVDLNTINTVGFGKMFNLFTKQQTHGHYFGQQFNQFMVGQ